MRQKAQLMDEAALNRALMRISHEIVEKNKGAENIVLVGIRRRGGPIAERIRDNIRRIEETDVPVGSIDIRFYRDDLSLENDLPAVRRTSLPFDVTGRDVVLADGILLRPPAQHPACGTGRPGPSGTPDPPGLCGQECPQFPHGADRGAPAGLRW